MAVFIALLATALLVGGAVAITFWDRICKWAENSFLPWVEIHLPYLYETAKAAFRSVDNAVSEIRRKIKTAWEKVRERLIGQLMEFRRELSGDWIVTVTTWVIEKIGAREVQQITTTQKVSRDEIPQEVKDAWLNRKQSTVKVNLTELRDEELSMTH
ncbi:hypothetical protein AAH991_14320 [Microbispora sp. ZYX-F-249]|uniref:Uncharacterized protein n=1 Tax=Microbispora maris TaxID=3144104 RepID=A0ABV0ALW7_9ACTN